MDKETRIEYLNMLIAGCKNYLDDTDYKCLKHSEGALTDEEYEPVRVERQKNRDLINKYQEELDKLMA